MARKLDEGEMLILEKAARILTPVLTDDVDGETQYRRMISDMISGVLVRVAPRGEPGIGLTARAGSGGRGQSHR